MDPKLSKLSIERSGLSPFEGYPSLACIRTRFVFIVQSNRVDRYSLISDSWQPLPLLTLKRNSLLTCILGNCLYAYGVPEDKRFHDEGTIERLADPGGSFTDLPSMIKTWKLIRLPKHEYCSWGLFVPLNSHEILICSGYNKVDYSESSSTIVNTETLECTHGKMSS